jgi:membrane fusion protein (multidrug efflux system)
MTIWTRYTLIVLVVLGPGTAWAQGTNPLRMEYAMKPAAKEPAAPAPATNGARASGGEVRILIIADRESTLSAPTAGRVASIDVRLGDAVAAGQVLVAFDCDEIKARREAAWAETKTARLQHEAKIKLQGLESAAEVEVELAAMNVDRAEAQARVFDAQLAQCRFAPAFAARVARIHVKTGQSVTAGAPIIDVVSIESLKARINVPSRWMAWLKVDDRMEAEVDETGRRYKLRVARIAARVDAVSQTIEIEAEFEGKTPDLLPGMSGRAFALRR